MDFPGLFSQMFGSVLAHDVAHAHECATAALHETLLVEHSNTTFLGVRTLTISEI
jgi:hypothetical protein